MLQLNKSFCFALEMARACSRLAFSLPPDFRVVELNYWLNRDHSHKARRVFEMKIRLSGVEGKVDCFSDVHRGDEGEWSNGLCYVSLEEGTFPKAYYCELDEGALHVSPMAMDLQELGFADDLVSALTASGINTASKLLGLTELQVCQIFQPRGPEVMVSLNPTEYIDGITFARLDRLRKALDEKGLRLKGRRQAPFELQMQL